MSATPGHIAALVLEFALLFAGVVLVWRLVLSPSARTRRPAPALPAWSIALPDFLLFTFVIFAGSLFASFVAGLALNGIKASTDTRTILASAAFQLGLLLTPLLLPLRLQSTPPDQSEFRAALRSGIATFLIALPVVTVVNLAWQALLQYAGLPAESQDLLRLFSRANSPALLVLMTVLATLIAPVGEELLFRGVMFRYLRTRLPRWIALLLPGTIFATLHVNWTNLDGLASFVPLIALAVVFSLAYERTGRLSTAMVAHGLFNLHTIALLFSGVTS